MLLAEKNAIFFKVWLQLSHTCTYLKLFSLDIGKCIFPFFIAFCILITHTRKLFSDKANTLQNQVKDME